MKKRNPVQRAASRLYRGPGRGPVVPQLASEQQMASTCVGPEFILRAQEKAMVVHLGGAAELSPRHRSRPSVSVLLLTGQKISLSVDYKSTTVAQVFQVSLVFLEN